MPINPRHPLRPALVALATLAGLLLVSGEASASCEAMKSAKGGTCPPSKVACCCNSSAETKVEAGIPVLETLRVAGSCCCAESTGAPAEPAPAPVRPTDDRGDRQEVPAVELSGVHASRPAIGQRPISRGSPPHIPLFLRHSRFLI